MGYKAYINYLMHLTHKQYYLNHVGYKEETSKSTAKFNNMYYLNHVGYKEVKIHDCYGGGA